MITASHNPAPYNGFKLVLGPLPVREEEVAQIASLVGEESVRACRRVAGKLGRSRRLSEGYCLPSRSWQN